MKRLPLLFALLFAAPLVAGDFEKKRPAPELAAENLKNAQNMQNEANWLDEQAATASPADAATLKEFSKLTREEAGWLKKSGEAYEKNQIRLGEKYQQNAMEYCEKRGKMGPKMEQIHHKLKKQEHLKKEEWAQKEHDQKKADHAKKDDWSQKPDHAKKDHPKPDSSDAELKQKKLAELERKQAELEAEKKKLLQD